MNPNHDFPPPSKTSIVACFLFSFVGFAMIVVAAVQAYQSWRFTTSGVQVPGIVTNVEEYKSKKGKMKQRYTGTFTTPDGASVPINVVGGTFSMNDKVTALALPSGSGYEVKQNHFDALWRGPIALASAGAFWAILLLLLTWFSLRRYREILSLIASGKRILVTVTMIDRRKRSSGKKKRASRPSYVVVANGPNGFAYRSESSTNRPSDSLIGREVPILVNPENPRSYYFPSPE